MNERLKKLASSINRRILELPGVNDSGRGSFRIGDKVFIRVDLQAEHLVYGFKLSREEARKACKDYTFVEPMRFGDMGKKGWVDVTITRKPQVVVLLKLIAHSRSLFN